MNSIAIEGGCLCGRVRYRVQCAPSVVLHCHCSDCRRATGAPFVTWAIFPREALAWITAAPRRFVHDERRRMFCPDCGTPLACMPGENADIIVVPVGTMDRPEVVTPACHAWTQDMLPWVHLADGLPQYETAIAPAPEAAPLDPVQAAETATTA